MLAGIPADLSLLLHICTEAELLRGRKLNPFDNQGSYRISEELSGPDQDQLAGPLMWSLRENCVGREGGRRGGKRTQLMPETALTLSAPNQVFAPPPRAQGCFEQV